jgi:hypothetical protein
VCFNVGSRINDRTSSIINNSNRDLVFYVDSECQGRSFVSRANTGNITLSGTEFNDKITAGRVV